MPLQAPNQAACPGCQYRIDGVYLWNSASWDIQAIYPESTSTEGSYLDPTLKVGVAPDASQAHKAPCSGIAYDWMPASGPSSCTCPAKLLQGSTCSGESVACLSKWRVNVA